MHLKQLIKSYFFQKLKTLQTLKTIDTGCKMIDRLDYLITSQSLLPVHTRMF